MSKISKSKLSYELKANALSLFLKKISEIKSVNDSEKFLDMFFTIDEKYVILKRLAVMILLNKKEKYGKIQNSLEISRNTISKIAQILSGYGYGKNVIKRKYSVIQKKEKSRKLFKAYKGAQSII